MDGVLNSLNREESFKFLLYSYFGITDSDTEQDIKLKCAGRAYRDLARTIQYSKSTTDLKNMGKQKAAEYMSRKEAFIQSVKERIVEYIDQIPDSNEYEVETYKEPFDKWHNEVCEEIKSISANAALIKTGTLSYGQAQKWLNMTIKYMRLLGLFRQNEGCRFDSALHVPVDSYLIEAAKAGEELKNALHIKCSKASWSSWEYDEYIAFQEAVRSASERFPIYWEGLVWMKVAERRKKQERENQSENG